MQLAQLETIPTTRQLLVVTADSTLPHGELVCYSRVSEDEWLVVDGRMKVSVGKQGVTLVKSEGDNQTPLGLFKLGLAFGKSIQPDFVRLNYRQITPTDKFIDDSSDLEYNTWISGETRARSFETMLRQDELYDLGVIIEYNMHPVIPGQGSAIFMHIWRGEGIGTEGCIAMARVNLERVMSWLNPLDEPYVLIC